MASLMGTYYHNIDAKGRMNFPTKLREILGTTFYVTKGLDQPCLTVCSAAEWERLAAKVAAIPESKGGQLHGEHDLVGVGDICGVDGLLVNDLAGCRGSRRGPCGVVLRVAFGGAHRDHVVGLHVAVHVEDHVRNEIVAQVGPRLVGDDAEAQQALRRIGELRCGAGITDRADVTCGKAASGVTVAGVAVDRILGTVHERDELGVVAGGGVALVKAMAGHGQRARSCC